MLICSLFRTSSNKTTCSFEVYGHPQTNTELIRLLYATLEQLFPSLKRELYENVDGQEATKSKPLYPEDSPLLPGSVKMHREANTSDENTLVIKNHFDRKDFIDMSPDIDLDLNYTDIALINQSNGMMSESHVNLSKQLNFGEEMRNNANLNINQRKITLTSHASRVEGIFLEYEESKTIAVLLFTKLVVPKSNVTFSVNDKPEAGLQPNVNSADFLPPSPSQRQNFTGNLPSISLQRARRAVRGVSWKYTEPISLRVKHSFTLFQKKVIGVNVKGEGSVWLEPRHGEIGVTFGLSIGGRYILVPIALFVSLSRRGLGTRKRRAASFSRAKAPPTKRNNDETGMRHATIRQTDMKDGSNSCIQQISVGKNNSKGFLCLFFQFFKKKNLCRC